MADINLLGSDSQKFNIAQTSAHLIVKILLGVLVVVILYYAYLRIQISRTQNSVRTLQAQTAAIEAEALNQKERGEVVTRQGQLQNLDSLIKNHLYWSPLLPELARVTLKSASYATFNADGTGVLNIDVTVPSYADADKYIQVFDLPQFNQQFSDVKILSINKVQEGNTVQIGMKLQLKFNPEFIRKTLQ